MAKFIRPVVLEKNTLVHHVAMKLLISAHVENFPIMKAN